jgi:hypothetical protein
MYNKAFSQLQVKSDVKAQNQVLGVTVKFVQIGSTIITTEESFASTGIRVFLQFALIVTTFI